MTQLRRIFGVSAALVATAVTARAQSAPPQPSTLLPQSSIAVNPLAIPLGVFSAEYEGALPTPGFTMGIGGTYYKDGHDKDAWLEVKGMYYPNETPFRGFSIGLSAGIQSATRNQTTCTPGFTGCTTSPRTQSAPTLGVLASYDWLLGRQERFRVGLGAGAKRVLKDVSGHPLEQVYPDGRFVIGVVF